MKTEARFLVFGSSRANHHYVPRIIEEEINMDYYNVGRDGSFIPYHYAVLCSILSRWTPNIVILDITKNDLIKQGDDYARLSVLLPYYEDNVSIRQVVNMKSKFEKIKLLSKIYPYNSQIFSIMLGNISSLSAKKKDEKGFVGLTDGFKGDTTKTNWIEELDERKVELYKRFIGKCKENGVLLYVVCSPYYLNDTISGKSVSLAKSIAVSAGVEFIDFSNDKGFVENKKLFYDKNHLNERGAIIFTKELSKRIEHNSKHKNGSN